MYESFKNYAYNLSYQLLVIVLPIPLRHLMLLGFFSSRDLGTYGYFNSIVTYFFILLATLGVANYGTKEISGHRKDIRKNFWGYLYPPIDCDYFVSYLVYIIMFVLSWYAKYGGLYLGLLRYRKEWIFLGYSV